MSNYLRSIATILTFAFASNLQAASIADQGQIFGTDGLLELGTDQWSQSITTGISGQLSGIEVQFDNERIPFGGPTISMSIFNGDNPVMGTPLFSELLSLTNADLGGPFDNVYLWDVRSAGLFFDVGDVFSLSFQAVAPGLFFPGNDGPGYDGGDLYKNGSVFGDGSFENPRDIGFITYVNPIPLPAAFWLFGTALVGLVGFSKRRKAA